MLNINDHKIVRILILFYILNFMFINQTILAQSGSLNGSGGGIIAFTSDRDGQNEIYLMNADGSSQVRVTITAEEEYFPKWSRDGSKIAYRVDGEIRIIQILDLPNGVINESQLVISMDGASIRVRGFGYLN